MAYFDGDTYIVQMQRVQKEFYMSAALTLQSTMSSKGQLTIPAALRTALGLTEGVKVNFVLDGKQLLLKPELPVSAYRGILRDLGDIDTAMPKEPDRF
jgi:AbrB family looped-hinge helix DNA binding protein